MAFKDDYNREIENLNRLLPDVVMSLMRLGNITDGELPRESEMFIEWSKYLIPLRDWVSYVYELDVKGRKR